MEGGEQSQPNTQQPRPPGGPPPGARRPTPESLLRRYKWNDLSLAEQEAVRDCMNIAMTRAGIGVGATLTLAAVLSNFRRGRQPLPPGLRYGSLAFFSIAGGYLGFMSAGEMYAKRILSVPNSNLADDLRIVIGDWEARTPVSEMETEAQPHDTLPDGAPGTGTGKNEIVARDPKVVRAEQRAKKIDLSEPTGHWTDRIGLTNKNDADSSSTKRPSDQ